MLTFFFFFFFVFFVFYPFQRANFYHKALLMRAELARVALMFVSTSIYSAVNIDPHDPLFNDSWYDDSDDNDEYDDIADSDDADGGETIREKEAKKEKEKKNKKNRRNNRNRKSKRQDFEEAMKLYESAIESAKQFGFQQYEAMGTRITKSCFVFISFINNFYPIIQLVPKYIYKEMII
jgi:hypothetical protein